MRIASKLFEYRGWPSDRTPHFERLHHYFGVGTADIRTDTYLLCPAAPHCVMIIRGGTRFEIRHKTGEQGPVAAWELQAESAFPLRRSLVAQLQTMFPASHLPDRISTPADLVSWVGGEAFVWNVSKRIVRFHAPGCEAELAVVNAHGRRAETFCIRAKRYEPIIDTLHLMPQSRLPNLDYGAWLQPQIQQRRLAQTPHYPQVDNDARFAPKAFATLKQWASAATRQLATPLAAAPGKGLVGLMKSDEPWRSSLGGKDQPRPGLRRIGFIRQPYLGGPYKKGEWVEGEGTGKQAQASLGPVTRFRQENVFLHVSAPGSSQPR